MREVLAEKQRYDDFDSEFRANPYSPWDPAMQLGKLGPSAAPFLVAALEREAERPWAIFALDVMGPPAAPVASDALAAHVTRTGEGVRALWSVDEARARAMGLHRKAPSRGEIAGACHYDFPKHAALLQDLLMDDDPDVLVFASGPGSYSDDSKIDYLAKRRPELVPTDLLRVLLVHPDDRVRENASKMLGALRFPSDAHAVLSVALDGTIAVFSTIDWLAPLERSEGLARGPSTPTNEHVFELVRRRRTAGLPTDPAIARERFRKAMHAPPVAHGMNDDRWRSQAIDYAARTIVECPDPELARDLVEAVGPPEGARRFEGTPEIVHIANALRALGAAGANALRQGRELADGDRKERLGWVATAMERGGAVMMEDHSKRADAMFVEGKLEMVNVVASAYDSYANELLVRPRSAHAAFQIAWIDRGFGTPIEPRRIDWLRDLGVPNELLDEVAAPPAATLGGFRPSYSSGSTYDEDAIPNAERARAAGFAGVASKYYAHAKQNDDARRCIAVATAHVERVKKLLSAG